MPEYSGNMWEISNYEQLLGFFRMLLLGGAFCLLYDIIRGLRAARNFSALQVFISDIAYFVLISPITFCFLLSITNGQLRGYAIFGLTVGFFLVRISVSRFFVIVFAAIFRISFKFFSSVSALFYGIFEKISLSFRGFIAFTVKNSKKAAICFKKLLKIK